MVESVDTKDLNSFGQQWLCGFKSRFGYKYAFAVVAQLVEHWLPKPKVTSSNLAYRSKINKRVGYTIYPTLLFFTHKQHHSTNKRVFNIDSQNTPIFPS